MAGVVSAVTLTKRKDGGEEDEDSSVKDEMQTPLSPPVTSLGAEIEGSPSEMLGVDMADNGSDVLDPSLLDFPPEVSRKIVEALSLRQKVHAIFDATGVEEEHFADLHRGLRIAVLSTSFSLIVVSVVLFMVESSPAFYRRGLWEFYGIEAGCICWFTLELVLRAVTCPSFAKFCKSGLNWIDFFSILPFFVDLAMLIGSNGDTGGAEDASGLVLIRVVRLTRAFRVFKLSKYNEGLQIVVNAVHRSTDALSLLLFLSTIATVLFGSAMFFAEQGAADFDEVRREWIRKEAYGGPEEPHKIKSIPHAFWWCFVTLTTVGYGDMAPVTLLGYIIATITMLSGLLLIAFPIIILGLNFSEARDEFLLKKERERFALVKHRKHLLEKLAQGDSLNSQEVGNVIKQVTNEALVDEPELPKKENLDTLIEELTEKLRVLEEKVNRYASAPSSKTHSLQRAAASVRRMRSLSSKDLVEASGTAKPTNPLARCARPSTSAGEGGNGVPGSGS